MQNKPKYRVVAVDAGSEQSGIVIVEDGRIKYAETSPNEEIYDLIKAEYCVGVKTRVVIEDVAPYKAQISPQLIKTCKYLGELEYRLKTARIAFRSVPRSTVKKYAFDQFPTIVGPLVSNKIRKAAQKGKTSLFKKDGITLREGTSVWVDDSMIVAAMRWRWDVPVPKPFQKGMVATHAWQALGLATYFIDTQMK